MRVKGSLVILALALLLAIPHLAMAARAVHDFDCKECHLSNSTINQLGGSNVCLRCHNTPLPVAVPMVRTSLVAVASVNTFVTGDASNHYGNNPASGVKAQTSHNWAATSTRAAAGAVEPSRTLHPGFYSRYGTTVGKVACSRCHDPHGESVVNPKLLPLKAGVPMTSNDMCIACHATFAAVGPAAHGFLSHPVGMKYNAAVLANPGKYQAVITDPAIALMADDTVSCTTCHGVHAVDSNASTTDGFASNNLGTGDGLLLRGDGTQFINDPAKSTTFCTSCHIVASTGIEAIHGSGTSSIGCMGCHGGHNYNNNSPSYYMLKDNYKRLPREVTGIETDPTRAELWGGVLSGTVDGFCETCHGDITAAPFNDVRVHFVGEDCSSCHQGHAEGSFSEPIGCDSCHGSPPGVNAPGNAAFGAGFAPSGFAWVSPTHSYNSSTVLKDESLTPHTSHAGASSNYKFQCRVCHNTHIDNFAGTHNKDNTSFQDVLETTSPYATPAKLAGQPNPTYDDGVTRGTCNTVYCHSNGGVNNGSGTRTFTYQAPNWAATAPGNKGDFGIGTGTECNKCHGNSAGAMGSTAHNAHLTAGFSCNLCHVSTATSSTDLVGVLTSPPATHINQTVNVAFDTASPLKPGGAAVANGASPYSNPTSMTCSAVYCHSSGQSAPASRVYKTISWNTAGSLTCTSCHDITSGVGQTAAHAAHVNGSTSNVGRDLDCAVCHDATMDAGNNNALAADGLAFHVNGRVDVKLPTSIDPATNCTTSYCHSDGNLDSVTNHSATANAKFIVPNWTTSGTYNACDKCHGNDTTNKSYPAYADGGVGTGDANSHNTHVASSLISCGQCHSDTSLTGTSLDGALPSKHVNKVIDVVFSQGGTFNAGDTCSATYCHGTGPSPAWGDTSPLACDTCHNASSALANSHGVHYNSATVATAINANNDTTTTKYIFQCGNCHNATTHAGGSVSAVQAAQVSLAGTGTYNAAVVSAGTDRGFSYTAGSCATNDCHNDGTAAKGAPNFVATWTVSLPVDCTGCHSNNAAAALKMASGSHAAHVNDGTIMANTACNSCHSVTVDATDRAIANKTRHIDGTRDIDIAATYDSDAIPANNFAANVCSNVYCHSDGKSTPTYKSVTWGTTISDCVSCHQGATAGTTLSGAHGAHVVNAVSTIGRNLGCVDCHAATVTSNTNIGTPANHVNKTVNVISCATNLCHSDGNFGALVQYNPNFATDTLGCANCHGNGTVSYPTYANGGTGVNANSHSAHIVGGGYTCNECHATTSTLGTSINGTTPTKHVDQTIDVNGSRIGSFSAGTCSAIACHGGNNATWGATLGCRDCHFGASDVDDFVYGGSTPVMAKVSESEWIFSGHGKPATANYEVTGRAGADFEAASTTGDACLYCHDGGISHSANNGTNNYFRLRQNVGPDLNGNCLGCHATGSAGVDPDGAATVFALKNSSVKIDKYHGGALHADPRDAGRFCWDCHDPHGDAAVAGVRIQMIQRNPQVNPNAMGVPASLSPTAVVFYNSAIGAGVGGFAMNTLSGTETYAQGICNNCHTTTAQYQNDSGLGTRGAGTHPTSTCTTCHAHSADTTYNGNAFKGSGCNGCHGNSVAGNYWPDSTAGAAMPAANDAGRHDKHMEILSSRVYSEQYNTVLLTNTAKGTTDDKQRYLCAFCHNTPGADFDHGVLANLPAEVNSMKQMWSPYNGDTAVWSLAGDGGKGTCATTDCHNNTTTPAGYSWYGATASACIMCHEVSALTDPTHVQHRNSIYGLIDEAAGNCGYCHDAATNWTANTKPANNHINGAFVVEGAKITAGTYDGVYPTSKGTCGTNVCHNDGRNGPPAATPYTWGTANASNCNSCHLNNAQGHQPHLAGTGTFFSSAGFMSCNKCHTHSGPSADHLNASINVLGTMGYTGTNLGISQTPSYGSCSTQVCHQDGKGNAVATPVWNRTPSSADDCSICHFNKAPESTTSHDTHIGATTPGVSSYLTAASNASTATEYRFNCANCHGNTLANHLNSATWATPTVNVAAGVNYNAGADTCNSNACHTNGTGGAANLTANWSTGWVADGDSDKCNNCHGNSPTSNAHQVHAVGIHATDIYSGTTGLLTPATATKSHGDAATSTTINCNLCHSQTVTMARNKFGSECFTCHSVNPADATNVMTIADKSKHVDGSKQVVFAMTAFKSKAQLRDNITTVAELNNNWTRTNGYKAATSFDQAKLAPAPTWNSGPKTCSTVDCHNGIQATWQAPANNCMACHTQLPK